MTEPLAITEHDLLATYRPWLLGVARELLRGWGGRSDRIDDVAQEGWIAIWRACHDNQRFDGAAPLDWWVKRHALWRMRQAVRDWHAPAKQRQHALTDDVAILVEHAATLPAVELAYHHGEIAAALDRLTPREREYVLLRFWGGYRLPQMRDHFGYNPSSLWRTAKAKLAADLAPLAALVAS